MENGVAAAVAEIVSGVFENTEYELVDVEFKKERSGWNIIIYADKPEGITLDDCEEITHMVDPLLDADERIANKHDHLIVSSPGLDRPLKTTRDFERCLGRKLEIKLFTPIQGKRELVAALDDVDAEKLYMTTEAHKSIEIKRADISSAKQYIDFN